MNKDLLYPDKHYKKFLSNCKSSTQKLCFRYHFVPKVFNMTDRSPRKYRYSEQTREVSLKRERRVNSNNNSNKREKYIKGRNKTLANYSYRSTNLRFFVNDLDGMWNRVPYGSTLMWSKSIVMGSILHVVTERSDIRIPAVLAIDSVTSLFPRWNGWNREPYYSKPICTVFLSVCDTRRA